MTMEPIDILSSLRTYLVSQSDLTDELTNAAYIFAPPGFPDYIVSSMPCKCITYLQSGGVPRGFQTPLTSVRIELRCYGATHIEASAVERKLARVLDKKNNVEIGDNCMFSARKATEAQSLQGIETGWPYCWIPYDVIFNQEVS